MMHAWFSEDSAPCEEQERLGIPAPQVCRLHMQVLPADSDGIFQRRSYPVKIEYPPTTPSFPLSCFCLGRPSVESRTHNPMCDTEASATPTPHVSNYQNRRRRERNYKDSLVYKRQHRYNFPVVTDQQNAKSCNNSPAKISMTPAPVSSVPNARNIGSSM